MTIYRVTTQKSSLYDDKFTNVYYIKAVDISEAGSIATQIGTYERDIMCSIVTLDVIHVDEIGSALFTNILVGEPGLVSSTPGVAPFICAKIIWSVENSYPCYKLYRVQVASTNMLGLNWSSGYQTVLSDYVTALNANFEGVLCTKAGVNLGNAVYDAKYFSQQLSKRWYDRPGA